MTMYEYQCSKCHKVFSKGWSDEEAIAEKDANWPGTDLGSCVIVCDDCYNDFRQKIPIEDGYYEERENDK
jgi:hypothetical protein